MTDTKNEACETPIIDRINRLIRDLNAGAILGYDGPAEYWSTRMGAEASKEVARLLSAALSVHAEPVAQIEFARGVSGRENEMPRVISCNWLPDGTYSVYLRPPVHEPVGRWRVFEDIDHGWYGIEIDGDNDADPILYPHKINRERLEKIVNAYNAAPARPPVQVPVVKALEFAGSEIMAIVEGIRGAMNHGTWRDEKGNRLKDTNEWVLFYTTFRDYLWHLKRAKEERDAGREQNAIAYESFGKAAVKASVLSAKDALQAIADLPTGASEDEMRGQEDAYRAVEALFESPPHIEVRDHHWRLNCQYLLDILDNQGFAASDLGEEDEDTINIIRSALESSAPVKGETEGSADLSRESEIPEDVLYVAHKAAVDWYGDSWLGPSDPETDAFKVIRQRLAEAIIADRRTREGVAP